MAEHTRDQSNENAEETLPTIEEMSGLIKTVGPPLDAEHTPGPWTVRHRCVGNSPNDDENCGLGLEVDGPPEAQLRGRFALAADAHLVAAAPELLAALEQALAVIASDEMRAACDMADLHGMPYRGPTVDRAAMRNLIAKARGEADPTSANEGRTT